MDVVQRPYSKPSFEYSFELNEDSEINDDMSHEIKKMLQRNAQNIAANGKIIANGHKSDSDDSDSSEFKYVLEPDVAMNRKLVIDEEHKSVEFTEKSHGGFSEVMDLSFSSKKRKSSESEEIDLSVSSKKRKSPVSEEIHEIALSKTVNNNNKNVDLNGCTELPDPHTTVEAKIKRSNSVCNEAKPPHELMAPSTHRYTSAFVKPVSQNSASGSGRKNRRKSSVPVRVEKVEEISDIKDIVEEYGVQPILDEQKAKGKDMEVPEESLDTPLDLTPKSKSPSPLNLEASTRVTDTTSPIDLSKKSNTVIPSTPETSTISTSPVESKPVDLTKPSRNSSPNGSQNGLLTPPNFSPGMMPFDPYQMQKLLENMSRMQTQFPNPALMQSQLIQFHALMQNAMLKGSMTANSFTGIKPQPRKNDKNDNFIKAEPRNDQTGVKDYQKFNLENLKKNGLIHTSSPTVEGLVPDQYLLPSQAHMFKDKSTKKKSRESSFHLESNIDSPKLENCPSMVEFDSKNNPAHVVETLKSYFPIVPHEKMTKSQLEEDPNPVKFYVKDNEQIRVIVDSLVQVGILDLSEQSTMEHEPLAFKYICRVCGQTFFHMEHLTRHLKKSHVQKKYQCSECDRSFHDAGNYRQHMRVHDENDIPYECPECHRRFRHKCTLKVHLRIHTGEKPFKCEICSATFKISSGLQTHMRKHTGETPYACEFCDLRFKCQSNLKQHLFQHTQVRPFPCEICGKTYSRKSIRDAHLLTHAKEMVKTQVSELPQSPMTVGGSD